MSPPARRLGEATAPEYDERRPLLAVPLGSCEQHGPHLPLDTDTRVAVAVAERWAATRDDVAVAPPLAYGASGEHAGFPGTLSIGLDALERVLVELVRSADHFRGVVLVNGHGGNAAAIGRAVTKLVREQRAVMAWSPTVPGGDAHAGRTETSLVLALAPKLVRTDRAVAGVTTPVAELWLAISEGGVAAVSPSGVLGDPTGASAREGEHLLELLVADLERSVEAWL